MELIFRNSVHYLIPVVNGSDGDDGDNVANDVDKKKADKQDSTKAATTATIASLKLLGQPLIVRNVGIASKFMKIDTIRIPDKFPGVIRLIREKFPSINIHSFSDHDDDDNSGRGSIGRDNDNSNQTNTNTTSSSSRNNTDDDENRRIVIKKEDVIDSNHNRRTNSFVLPINSIIYYYQNDNNSKNNNNNDLLTIHPIVYPWDFLNAVKKVLHDEVTRRMISSTASVAKSSVIEGPCIIEDGVTIDDFCKIKGPVYIGNDSFIGTGSLVRNCMIGNNTQIGFNCEISNSYFKGHDVTAHLNVIGESIIGEHVWFGAYSLPGNVMLTKQNIKYEISDGKSLDTGTFRFGAVIGDNCKIGASAIVLPGREVPAYTEIQPEAIFRKVSSFHQT